MDGEQATPRDVKILHLILASMGVSSYQDQVPLQLMDFAHRYTMNVLNDALAYNDYANSTGAQLPAGVGASGQPLSVDDIRLAVSARVQNQFKPAAPKEMLLELAQERNKRALPSVAHTYGLRLPPEKYCLTGKEQSLNDEDDITYSCFEPISAEDETDQAAEQNDEKIDEDEDVDVPAEGEEIVAEEMDTNE